MPDSGSARRPASGLGRRPARSGRAAIRARRADCRSHRSIAGILTACAILTACGIFDATSPFDGDGSNIPPVAEDSFCSIPEELVVSGGVGRDGIPALRNPSLVPSHHAEATYLGEADRVIGIEADGRFIAVPHNILWWHEIVNFDDFGSPIAVTYCPLTGSSMVFDRSAIEGADLGVSGLLFHNNLMMFNRRSDGTRESLFPQMLRSARCGPLDGQPLELLPSMEIRWNAWKDLHPETLVVSGIRARGGDYEHYPYADYEVVDNGQTLFPNPEFDTRRPPKERVLGIPRDNGHGMAFPFIVLESRGDVVVVHDDVQGTQSVVVFWSSRAQSAMAYEPMVNGRDLAFEVRDGRFFDVQTGSRWTLGGRAADGPLEGSALEPVRDAYVAFWFAWATFHPNTEVLSGPLRIS